MEQQGNLLWDEQYELKGFWQTGWQTHSLCFLLWWGSDRHIWHRCPRQTATLYRMLTAETDIFRCQDICVKVNNLLLNNTTMTKEITFQCFAVFLDGCRCQMQKIRYLKDIMSERLCECPCNKNVKMSSILNIYIPESVIQNSHITDTGFLLQSTKIT